MSGYLAKRMIGTIPTLLGVSLLAFLFVRLIPGDAIAARLGTSTVLTPGGRTACERTSGSTSRCRSSTGRLSSLARGDAGYSIRTGRPVLASSRNGCR